MQPACGVSVYLIARHYHPHKFPPLPHRAKVSVALRRAVRRVNLDLLRQQTGLSEAYFLQCFSDRAMATVHFSGQQIWSARQLTDSPFRQCLDAGTDSLQTVLENYLREVVGLIRALRPAEETPFAQPDTAYTWLTDQQFDPRTCLLPTWEALCRDMAAPVYLTDAARYAFDAATPAAEADGWQQRLLEHRAWLEKLDAFLEHPTASPTRWAALVEAFAAHVGVASPGENAASVAMPPGDPTDALWVCSRLLHHFHFRQTSV